MSDPKQPIYDAMNWLGTAIPGRTPDDSQLIIDAYERAYSIEDKKTQEIFLGLIKELRLSNGVINRVVVAWSKSADRLRDAVDLIEKRKGEKP